MADTKISALTALDNADLAADDVLPIVDTNAVATKKITVANLLAGSPSNPNVQQSDIGTDPNQVPLNQYLGSMAYQDADNIAGDVGVGGDLQVDGVINNSVKIDTSGNVGIGTSSPSASAILDAQSTTKGVRMPNMTTAQKNAIASPAAGLMVFDTTLSKLCVYTGVAWETVTSI